MEDFDRWAYESALHEGDPSPVEHALAMLEEHGHTYRSEGALWLRTTDFGDDKDRVLVRSNGEHTYFASDIAYHQDKRERGFDRQIDVWGADHHGYVPRMKAAYEALGGDPDAARAADHAARAPGARAASARRCPSAPASSSRSTSCVAEIGVDATRWYLLARSHDTTVDLDLDLAREQSSENPVYYVQYAHARIVSILAKAGERARARRRSASARASASASRCTPAERALIELLLAFPARGGRGGRAPRPAPDRGLRARAGAGLHRLLPRLSRASAPSRRRRVAAHRAVRRERAHDRALPGAARRERAAGDVAGARAPQSKRARSASRRAASPASSVGARRLAAAPLRARAAPAREQQREHRASSAEHDGERHEVGGEVEAVRARQPEHGGAVLGDERALDLRFVLALVDQALDVCALAVGLRRLGDVRAGFCR